VNLDDKDLLLQLARTSLSSKVVSQYASVIAPIVVDSILKVAGNDGTSVDLRDIKMVCRVGGTVEDTELVDGIVFDQKASHFAGGVPRVEKAKVGLIQFCLSAPKTDMDNSIVITDFTQMDRVLKEERNYILDLCKRIKKSGCNVLLVQKSIMRDAVSDLALHFLAKFKIMVIKDIERDEVEFVCKTLGCKPVASIESMTPEVLGGADLVEEVQAGNSRLVKMSGVSNPGRTVSIFVRGSNQLVLDEAERSIHDALCVMRCIVKKQALISGGGAPEMQMTLALEKWANTLTGRISLCVKEFSRAFEVIPSTLAENAGLNPIVTVTELRNSHTDGKTEYGINVRKGTLSDMREENVVQPLFVSLSSMELACQTVRSILKIDDIVAAR
jgi:T-complex protein 1 subunit delta